MSCYTSRLSRDCLKRKERLGMSKWWHKEAQVYFPCSGKLHRTKIFQHSLERQRRVKQAKFISASSWQIRRAALVSNSTLCICDRWRGTATVWSLKHLTLGGYRESPGPSKLTQFLQYVTSLTGFYALPVFLLLLIYEYLYLYVCEIAHLLFTWQNLKAAPNRAFKWQCTFCWQLGLIL